MKKLLKILLIIFSLTFGLLAECYSQNSLIIRPNFNTEFTSASGKLSASNIYLSYISMDLIYDQLSANKVDKKKEEKLLNSIAFINEGLQDNLKLYYSMVESDKDAKFIYKLVDLTKKLNKNAILLNKIIKYRKEKDIKAFYTKHLLIWNKINKLFSKK